MDGKEKLRAAIVRFNRTRARDVSVDERPGCVYGLLTRDLADDVKAGLADVRAQLAELRRLLAGIFVALALTFVGVVVDLILRAAALR